MCTCVCLCMCVCECVFNDKRHDRTATKGRSMHMLCGLSCKEVASAKCLPVCSHTQTHTHIEIDRSVNCVFNLQYTCAFIYKHVLISLHSFQDIYIKPTREMAKKMGRKTTTLHVQSAMKWKYTLQRGTYVYTCLCTA